MNHFNNHIFTQTLLAVAWVFRWTFYPHALREERGSSDGKFLLLLFLFHTSKFVFLPGRKKLKFCSYPAEKSSSCVPTRPRKAQVFVSLRYRKRREVGRRVGLSLSMRSCLSSPPPPPPSPPPSHLQLLNANTSFMCFS